MRYAGFVERELSELVGMLTLYTGTPHVAEELAVDALVRAGERWARVSGLDDPGGWVRRVAINLANSFFRRRAAERRALRRLQPVEHHPPDVATTMAVREAVARLPERVRLVIVHRYYLDCSVRETAEALGLTPGSVRVYASRGLEMLRGTRGQGLRDPARRGGRSSQHG